MLESMLSQKFSSEFDCYQLWKPSNRAAGWPDIGIQIGISQFVWCELKVTTIRSDGLILLDNLQKEQAAFLYKWQRNNGFCFVLAALLGRGAPGGLISYIVVRPFLYKDWLNVNRTLYKQTDLLSFKDMPAILEWFRITYIPQYRSNGWLRK